MHDLTLGKIVLMDLCGPPHVGPVRFLLCDFFAPALCYVYINTAAFGFFCLAFRASHLDPTLPATQRSLDDKCMTVSAQYF